MTNGAQISLSLLAMRSIAASEICAFEAKANTHVLKPRDWMLHILRLQGLGILAGRTVLEDINATASIVIDAQNVTVGSAAQIEVSINGASLYTETILNILADPDAAATAMQAAIVGTYSAATVAYELSEDLHVFTITGPPAMDEIEIIVEFSGASSLDEIEVESSEEFSGGYFAGEIKTKIPCKTISRLFGSLSAYYRASSCCDDVFEITPVCDKNQALPDGVGIFHPVAFLRAIPPVVQGNPTTFDGSQSINRVSGENRNSALLIYEWNFGDGATAGPTLGLSSVQHTFSSQGTYTVTLKVTDSNGLSHTDVKSITAASAASGIGTWIIGDDFQIG